MKERIFKIFLVCLLLVTSALHAQQLPLFSEYMFDKTIINPAYTGTTPYINATAGHRSQFLGIPGGPQTQFLSVNAPIQSKYIGVGLKAINDKIGATNNASMAGMFSYYLGLGKGRLSFGIEAGTVNQTTNFADLIRTDQADNSITFDKQTKWVPDASFGTYYQTQNFFMGFSSFHLLKSKIDFTGYSHSPVNRLWHHNYLIIGYNYKASENFRIEPSVLVKQVKAAPVQYDVNCKFQIKQLVSLGFSYRSKDAFVSMLEILLKDQFKIGFAYDRTISSLSNYTSGSYEFMLTYKKKLLPPAHQKEIHPRFYLY